jgi:UDP-N-acetyl-2-amino-2-deoxyglucuronate dehydrogenase
LAFFNPAATFSCADSLAPGPPGLAAVALPPDADCEMDPAKEVALVKFSNGVLGKVSVNADCIMPYRFPFRIFGSKGSVFDNRIWSHKFPGQKHWEELPGICPDSSDVRHHPFQGEMDHFVECIQSNRESHCNLEDAVKTHEVVFGALRSYETGRPVCLPLTAEDV